MLQKNINNNEPDQVWTHDKYESLESDQKDTKNAINASAPVNIFNFNPYIFKKSKFQSFFIN